MQISRDKYKSHEIDISNTLAEVSTSRSLSMKGGMPTQVKSINDAAKLISSSLNGRENIDDAFWLCDIGDAAAHLRIWAKAMPGIRPYFAIKSAPYPTLLKFFLLSGIGLDCASQAEMKMALSLGANPQDIVFSNTNKQITHLEYARCNNINLTMFDSEEELRKIKQYHPDAELMLRLKVLNSTVAINLNNRFGCRFEHCKPLIKLAKELGMNMVGICFHVGTGCYEKAAYIRALHDARNLFDYGSSVGYNFKVLDIGGGFRGIEEEKDEFQEYAKAIRECLTTLFPEDNKNKLRIVAEPGKFFATSACTLVTNVIAKAEGDTQEPIVYTVNDGVYGCLQLHVRNMLGTNELMPRVLSEEKRSLRECRIDGATCSGLDIICSNTLPEANIGEWIIWKNSGSYSFALSSDFNGYSCGKFFAIVTQENRDLIDDVVLQKLANAAK